MIQRIGVECSLGAGPQAGGRSRNEDNFLVATEGVARWREGSRVLNGRWAGTGALVAVADGMGGHADGDLASLQAVQALMRWECQHATDDPQEGLRSFVLDAHYAIRTTMPRPIQMGTTLVVAWMLDDHVWWTNVGDSRLYVLRKGILHLLTRDQTREEFARRDKRTIPAHPSLLAQNFIFGSRGLGNDAGIRLDVGLDTGGFRLEPGDRLLLCSDGVTGWMEDAEIGLALRDARDPWSGAQNLIERAIAAHSEDNITAIMVFSDRATLDVGATIIPTDKP